MIGAGDDGSTDSGEGFDDMTFPEPFPLVCENRFPLPFSAMNFFSDNLNTTKTKKILPQRNYKLESKTCNEKRFP